MTGEIGKVALLWRGDREARNSLHPRHNRLEPVFAALAALNIYPEPAGAHSATPGGSGFSRRATRPTHHTLQVCA